MCVPYESQWCYMSLMLSAIVEYVEENHKSWMMHVFHKEEVVRLYSINSRYYWPMVINCNEQTIHIDDGKLESHAYTEQSVLQKIDELISRCEKRGKLVP